MVWYMLMIVYLSMHVHGHVKEKCLRLDRLQPSLHVMLKGLLSKAKDMNQTRLQTYVYTGVPVAT